MLKKLFFCGTQRFRAKENWMDVFYTKQTYFPINQFPTFDAALDGNNPQVFLFCVG